MNHPTKSERRDLKRMKRAQKQHKGGTLAGVRHKLMVTRNFQGTAKRITKSLIPNT